MAAMEQTPKPSKRLLSSRENGSEGGRKRAEIYGPEVLSEWGSRGGQAVLAKYGHDYFVQLRKRRNSYPNYSDQSSAAEFARKKIIARVNRENGRKGGLARASLYSYEHFREWGRVGGIETWVRHGKKFYREIRKKRTFYLKGYRQPKTIRRLKKYCERMARKQKGLATASLWRALAKDFAYQLTRPRSVEEITKRLRNPSLYGDL